MQIGCFCWASLISSSFNIVSRCKTLTLFALSTFGFFYWPPFIKLLDYESLGSLFSSFYTDVRWSTCAQTQMVYGGGGSDLELTSDQKFFGVTPACAVHFHIDAWVITWDLISHFCLKVHVLGFRLTRTVLHSLRTLLRGQSLHMHALVCM